MPKHMPFSLIAALVAGGFSVGWAQEISQSVKQSTAIAAQTVASSSGAYASDPDAELSNQLKQAEVFYDEGLRRFKAGEVKRGRAQLKKAFDIILSNLEEETLPESLRAEFAAMLDKVRNWDNLDEAAAGDGASIDEPEDALKSNGTAAVKMRGIKVDTDNPITQRFIELYTKKRAKSVEEALARSGRYRDMINAALKKAGLPQELFHLVMAESEYKYNAFSRSGAAGLWQFMPETGRKYGLEVSYWVDERYVPEKATQAAIRYLSDLYQWFGDWNLAIAAYNRGEGGLGRDMQYSRSIDFNSLSGRKALPLQTHQYVPKFMACILIGSNPEKYGLHPKYEEPEAYDTVTLPRALDLSIAARCAKTTEAAIRRLNPQLKSWCTPKDRPDFALRIPKGLKEDFSASLAKVQDWNPGPSLVRYRVRRGDFLGKIARQNHTTVREILQINKLRNPRLIRPGMVLMIRPDRGRGRKQRG